MASYGSTITGDGDCQSADSLSDMTNRKYSNFSGRTKQNKTKFVPITIENPMYRNYH